MGGPAVGGHVLYGPAARGYTHRPYPAAGRYRTGEPRIGVSIAHLGHAARLWSPALACVLLHGIVPDLTELRRADDGPALCLPRPAGWYAERLPDPALALNEQVMRQLRALESGLRVKIAPRLLDGNAASALVGSAQVLLSARPELHEPLTDLTTRLLDTGRLAGTGVITGPGLTFRRRSCCLYYRVPDGSKCGDCCLAGRDGPPA
ncbi:(2Fe-2S)-binding protein [Streptomyces sp. NPDC127091]|uniref:(2Fe-2S)-binding protein n=1 Tax=Streptomyces sp. NPDC127091 TaxID=3347134 RepID=UPI00366634E2